MRLGRGKDELYVGRRLFKGLQECVERTVGEHVDFVNDKDLVAAVGGEILDIIAQFADFIDAVVRSAIDLEYIDRIPFSDFATDRAFVAGLGRGTLLAVQGFSQNPC